MQIWEVQRVNSAIRQKQTLEAATESGFQGVEGILSGQISLNSTLGSGWTTDSTLQVVGFSWGRPYSCILSTCYSTSSCWWIPFFRDACLSNFAQAMSKIFSLLKSSYLAAFQAAVSPLSSATLGSWKFSKWPGKESTPSQFQSVESYEIRSTRCTSPKKERWWTMPVYVHSSQNASQTFGFRKELVGTAISSKPISYFQTSSGHKLVRLQSNKHPRPRSKRSVSEPICSAERRNSLDFSGSSRKLQPTVNCNSFGLPRASHELLVSATRWPQKRSYTPTPQQNAQWHTVTVFDEIPENYTKFIYYIITILNPSWHWQR